jgi:hypothetical protein
MRAKEILANFEFDIECEVDSWQWIASAGSECQPALGPSSVSS